MFYNGFKNHVFNENEAEDYKSQNKRALTADRIQINSKFSYSWVIFFCEEFKYVP